MTDIIVEVTGAGGATNLQALTDVDTSGAVDGQVLTYVLTSGNWEPTAASGVTTLAALDDTNTTGVANGYILEYSTATNKFEVVPNTGGAGASALTDLTDVTITAVATGEVLRYNGSAWVDAQLSYNDLSDTPTHSTVSATGEYTDLLNIPTTFNPSAHTHVKADITDFSDSDYATAAQGTIADSATQPGDNVSTLVNDSGFLTSNAVDSVAGRTGAVVIVKADIADFGTYATTAQGTLADSALQTGANVSVLTNDSGFITSAPVDSVAGKTGVVTIVKADIADFGTYATTAQGALADSALQNVTGESIKDLSDVFSAMTPTDGQLLTFDNTNGWQAQNAPAAGAVAWGDLTGSITSQTDLQTELDGKATTAQGTLADTATQPADNISTLTNDSGFITSAPVDSVAGRTGAVVIVKSDIADFGTYATTAQGSLADSATQPADNISTLTNDSGFTDDQTGAEIKAAYEAELNTNAFTDANVTTLGTAIQTGANVSVFTNDAGYITSAPVDSVAGRTGAVVIVKSDIADFGTYATTAQGTLADSATQPADNISTLTNDSGFITGLAWGGVTGTLADQTDLQSALDTKQEITTATLQSTDATPTALATITIPLDDEKIISVKVQGHEDATDDHIWKTMTCCAKNIGGTATLVGGVDAATGYDAGATTWTIVAGVSSGNATITITGEAAHTINWRATIVID